MRQLTVGYTRSNRSEDAGLSKIIDAIEEVGCSACPLEVPGFSAHPDVFLAYGDRREQLLAAAVAHSEEIPIAHVHGGEHTLGSLDNRSRWALSSLATISFAATEAAADRLFELNCVLEHSHAIYWTGAPSLDDIEPTAGGKSQPFILCTLHPSCDRDGRPENYTHVFQALATLGVRVVFTAPSGEPGSGDILEHIRHYVANRDAVFVPNMGVRRYREYMSHCMMMVGNSSSGIIEAPSFGCPVVDIGDRQHMRDEGENVVHCVPSYPEILRLMREHPPRRLYDNPYRKRGGGAAKRIAEVLCRGL